MEVLEPPFPENDLGLLPSRYSDFTLYYLYSCKTYAEVPMETTRNASRFTGDITLPRLAALMKQLWIYAGC